MVYPRPLPKTYFSKLARPMTYSGNMDPWPVVKSGYCILGIYEPGIHEIATFARRNPSLSNASRNLNAVIHRRGKTLAVPISSVLTPVRVSRRRKVEVRPWPVMFLSDWLKLCFENRRYGGFYWLGGHTMDQLPEVETMLERFWDRYSQLGPMESSQCPSNPSRCIPFLLHGDEGRGQCKRPLLVLSYQPLLGWHGEDLVNSKAIFGMYRVWTLVCWGVADSGTHSQPGCCTQSSLLATTRRRARACKPCLKASRRTPTI